MRYLVILACFLSSCSVGMLVTTEPEGAKVFLEEEYVGESPCTVYFSYTLQKFRLRIEKEGYEPQDALVNKEVRVIRHSKSYQVSNSGEASTRVGEWPSELRVRLKKDSSD